MLLLLLLLRVFPVLVLINSVVAFLYGLVGTGCRISAKTGSFIFTVTGQYRPSRIAVSPPDIPG